MAHVITQPCCNDASCVAVCPVYCIHPTPEEPGYGQAEMLYIDADTCIDCGACVDVCPVGAIVPDDELSAEDERYVDINALYFEQNNYEPRPLPAAAAPSPAAARTARRLRVAVVGSGPAASYAAEELLSRRSVEVDVTMFERLPTPWGLVRSGVAPDHQGTKAVTQQFEKTASRPAATVYLNVEIGTHLTHAELMDHHDAVIYAVGASSDRRLGVPGEDLPGSIAATRLVGWYNGHPDAADVDLDLDCERAVVVGNGNVALDVARILVSDVDRLRRTDIAEHALEKLAQSSIREVVVVGRRGPLQAAYSTPELLGLSWVPGVVVGTEPGEVVLDDVSRAILEQRPDALAALKAELAAELAGRPVPDGDRSIRLRYGLAPHEILGEDAVTGIRFARTSLVLGSDGSAQVRTVDGDFEELECGLVVRAVGYRGVPLAGVPFDEDRGTIPNDDGRVIDPASGRPMAGVYVTGWIKRGPSGVIGTNRGCAADTVRHLLDDYVADRLTAPARSPDELDALVRARQPQALGYADWKAIDAHELRLGADAERPRVKITDVPRMVDVAVAVHS